MNIDFDQPRHIAVGACEHYNITCVLTEQQTGIFTGADIYSFRMAQPYYIY